MHSSEPRIMSAPSSVSRVQRFGSTRCLFACVLACSLSIADGFSPQSQLLAFSPSRLIGGVGMFQRCGSLSSSLSPTSSELVSRHSSRSLRWLATATFKAQAKGGGAQPEGGWAPPPWKRKVTNPLDSLKPGMRLPGVVRNIEAFGAYIDIGAERDGFIHISDLSTEFVHSPRDLLQPGKEVQAWVKYVDVEAMKLQLTLVEHKVDAEAVRKLSIERFATIVGEEVEGTITRITNYGAYMDIGCEAEAWLHSTELPKPKGAPKRMILDDLIVGRPMKVRIVEVDLFSNRIKVTGRSKDDVEKKRIFGAPPEDKRSVFVRGPRPPASD